MKNTIYLDSASGSRVRPSRILREAASVSLHPKEGAELADAARTLIAELFGAGGPECVFFTKSATEALSIVIRSFMRYGDMALTTAFEHESVLRTLLSLTGEAERLSKEYYFRSRTGGSPITGFAVCGLRKDGSIDYGELRRTAVRKRPRLIVCSHASPLTGDLIDLMAVGKIAREVGAHFVVDAAQTAGIFDIDLEEAGIDAVCFSGYKALLAPEGIGGFVLRDAALRKLYEPGPLFSEMPSLRAAFSAGSKNRMPVDSPRGQAPNTSRGGALSEAAPAPVPGNFDPYGRTDTGVPNIPGIAGLHASLRYLKLAGVRAGRAGQLARAREFYEGVREIPGVRIYGCFEDYRRAPIVALNLKTKPAASLAAALRAHYGIAVDCGALFAPLHAKELGIEKKGAVRFSFSRFTTEADVQEAVAAISELAGGPEQ